MGWEDRYPTRDREKSPIDNYSIQIQVFNKLKPIREIPDEQWREQIRRNLQPHLQQPNKDNLAKAVLCVARIWGVVRQQGEKTKGSWADIVRAATAFVPVTGPAGLGDLFTMAADVALDYVGGFRGALREFEGAKVSQEQQAVLDFLNPGGWGTESVGQWAGKLLEIGEFGISAAQFGKSKDIDQINVDALEEYMRIVRPLLYLYWKDRGGLKLTALK